MHNLAIDVVTTNPHVADSGLVPGHQRPELHGRDPEVVIAETIDDISRFADLVAAGEDAGAIVTALSARYPEHANPGALVWAAQLASSRTAATHS